MRISDWSSDVCSSDLLPAYPLADRRSEASAQGSGYSPRRADEIPVQGRQRAAPRQSEIGQRRRRAADRAEIFLVEQIIDIDLELHFPERPGIAEVIARIDAEHGVARPILDPALRIGGDRKSTRR